MDQLIMDDALLIIATSGTSPDGLFREILPLLLILTGLTVVGGIILLLLRRSINSNESTEPEGFTLQGLRDLHASGQLTDEEFEVAKNAMIARIQTNQNEQSSNGGDNTHTSSDLSDRQDQPHKPANEK